MEPSPSPSDPNFARIELLVQQTRQSILGDIEQLLDRQVEPLLEQTREMLVTSSDTVLRQQAEPLLVRIRALLLETVEEMARRQIEPLIDRTRQMLVQLAEEIVQRHAGPLVGQLRTVVQQTLEDIVPSQLQPLLQLARASATENAELAARFTDTIIGRLKATLAEPAAQLLRQEAPTFAQRLGRRTLNYVLAGTLFAVAVVFLLVGLVQGMQAAGVPAYLSHILSGLTALGGGMVFWRLTWRASA